MAATPPPGTPGGPKMRSLAKIDSVRRGIIRTMGPYLKCGRPMTFDEVTTLIACLAEYLGTTPHAVLLAISPWVNNAGAQSSDLVNGAAPYLAANLERLRSGLPSAPFVPSGLDSIKLGPAAVRLVDMARDGAHKGAVRYFGRIEWGLLYGQFCYIRSDLAGARQGMLKYRLGLDDKYRKRMRLDHITPRHLIGCLLWVDIVYQPSWPFQWGARNVMLAGRPITNHKAFVTFNRKLHKLRITEPCAVPTLGQLPCHKCPVGSAYCNRAVRLENKESVVQCTSSPPARV